MEKLKKYLNKSNIEKYIFFAECAIIIIFIIVNTLAQGKYVDFWPINGSFQNYNPVRRMLSGQIPYIDFNDYLGLGHLYLGSIVTKLFGSDFKASLMAFSFLCVFSAVLMVIEMGGIISQNKIVAATLMLMAVDIFGDKMVVGNSARLVRGMILPLVIFAFLTGNIIYVKYFASKNNIKKIFLVLGISGLAGISFLWSNDYGISCCLCLLIMTFIIVLIRKRKIFKAVIYTGITACATVLFIFLFAFILTKGNFSSWFESIFSIGGYQRWYYNSDNKSFYIYNLDFTVIIIVQAFLCMIYLFKLNKKRGIKAAIIRYGIPAFVNMVCVCAANEYKLLSGGYNHDFIKIIVHINILFEIVNGIIKLNKKTYINYILMVFCIIFFFEGCVGKIGVKLSYINAPKTGVYIEQLGGYINQYGDALINTEKFLDGNDFFSTYASAQEVLSGIYQPSGTDYIIHVLGDAKREEYMKAFTEGNFKYAATMNEEEIYWEHWIKRANWFFYRELYSNWKPVYKNKYEIFWERKEDKNENVLTEGIKLSVEDIDSSNKKIIIQCDESVEGMADVYIDYALGKNNNISSLFVFQTMVHVGDISDGYKSNYLRNASCEYIPIYVKEGYGEVTITSLPEKNTFLNLNESHCDRIFIYN